MDESEVIKLMEDYWQPEKPKRNEQSDVLSIFKVTMPVWGIWPGRVTLHVSYTKEAAKQFIEDYPNKLLSCWMRVEEQELIILRETD